MKSRIRQNASSLAFLAASAAAVSVSAVPASATTLAYEATSGRGFGTLDLTSGAFTQLGLSDVQLSGLGVGSDGQLYAGEYRGSRFYRVNRLNGALTLIGNSGITFGDTASTLTGLFGLSTDNRLYSIDITSAVATEIGSLGAQFGAFNGTIGMSTNSAVLYATHNTNLFTVDTHTGAATLVGGGSASLAALVTVNGSLYGGSGSSIYAVNPSTGQDTFVADEGNSYRGSFFGLAAGTISAGAVPEPGTWATMLLGLGGIGCAMRRNRKVAVSFS